MDSSWYHMMSYAAGWEVPFCYGTTWFIIVTTKTATVRYTESVRPSSCLHILFEIHFNIIILRSMSRHPDLPSGFLTWSLPIKIRYHAFHGPLTHALSRASYISWLKKSRVDDADGDAYCRGETWQYRARRMGEDAAKTVCRPVQALRCLAREYKRREIFTFRVYLQG